MARFDVELLRSLVGSGYEVPLRLLQTLPGTNLMGAAMLLVEMGGDMSLFGSAQRLVSWVGSPSPGCLSGHGQKWVTR